MDEHTLKEVIRDRARLDARASAGCPDHVTLAAALDGALDPARRAGFEAHVADCDHCIAALGRMARLQHCEGPDRVAETTLARARKLVGRRAGLPQLGRWAAAAAVVLAVLATATQFMPDSEAPEPNSLPVPEIRNLDHDAYRPAVLVPNDGASLAARGALFRWSEVPGSLHYNIRIVSADGGIVWQQRVDDTEWRLPPALNLASGEAYYFRVDAYLSEAKSLGSRHVRFRVEGSR